MMLTADDIVRELFDIEYAIDWEAVRAGFGVHKSQKIGAGFQFGGIKPEYFWPTGHPNESASEIYDEPYVTVWRTTRKIAVFILDDLSSSMDFGAELLKRERAARLAAAIAFSAYQVPRDYVAYIGFSDRVEPSMQLDMEKYGKDLPWQIANARLQFRGARKDASGFPEALEYLPRYEPSLCFVISDFWPQETFLPHLAAVTETHDIDIVPVVIRDLWEETLPEGSGYLPLVDAETGAELLVPLSARDKLGDAIRLENDRLRSAFEKVGIEPVFCDPDGHAGRDVLRIAEFFLRRLEA